MKSKKITGYTVFTLFNTLFMLFIIFAMAYPVYYVVVASISDPVLLSRHIGALWAPLGDITFVAYEKVFSDPLIISGFKNTFFVLIVGVIVNMLVTVMGAFFLSLKGAMLKNAITFMIIVTMYFSGGMVPAYLNIKDLGLMNSICALVIPCALNTTNLIIMKTAFMGIPDSLIESAQLDGASYAQILFKIMLPLAKATMAVILLYYAVSHWNSWFSASIYLQDATKFPLQLVMRNLLNNVASIEGGMGDQEAALLVDMIKYALIVVGTAPILALYPFLQKYFSKGVMIGAVKG